MESESPSDGNDTRHWWHIDRDTPVGGLGMAFASLQGASSDIHQAQQLSADKYPQSDVWGDPTFWIISVSTNTWMTCLRRKGDTCTKGLARTAGLERKCTTPWRTGISERYQHQKPGGTSLRPTMRRQVILVYSEPPTGSVSSTGRKAAEPTWRESSVCAVPATESRLHLMLSIHHYTLSQ